MHDLLLGPHPSVMDEQHLRIHYDFHGAVAVLAYPGGDCLDAAKGAKWVRRVKSEEAFAVLEHFLTKRVRWFRDHRRSTKSK